MASDFIFMLTRSDRTIPDAHERVLDALSAGVRHIGFKDIGLESGSLRRLVDRIRAAGAKLYLEIVSLDRQSEEASARAAVELGVDVLMGSTHPQVVMPILAGTGIKYFPFPGKVVGHPSVLAGSTRDVVESASQLAALDGVHGLDLLAYRFQGDVPDLISQVCRAIAPKPVVVAGSIDRPERIAAIMAAGAAGFTVGTAALDGLFPARSTALVDQLAFIVQQTSAQPI